MFNSLLKLLGNAGHNIQQNVSHPQNILNNLAHDIHGVGQAANQILHPQVQFLPPKYVTQNSILPQINTLWQPSSTPYNNPLPHFETNSPYNPNPMSGNSELITPRQFYVPPPQRAYDVPWNAPVGPPGYPQAFSNRMTLPTGMGARVKPIPNTSASPYQYNQANSI